MEPPTRLQRYPKYVWKVRYRDPRRGKVGDSEGSIGLKVPKVIYQEWTTRVHLLVVFVDT